MPTGYVFEIPDWRNRLVRLSQRNLDRHTLYRPYCPEYVEEVKTTIRDPDNVQESDTGVTFLHRLGLGRPPFTRLYLKVIIGYQWREHRQIGLLRTFFFSDQLEWDLPISELRAQWFGGTRYPRQVE
jgi:hypothetical protein